MTARVKLEDLSEESKKIVDRALTYTRAGCPIKTSHIISDLVRRIQELDNTNAK